MDYRSYYEILGIEQTATQDMVKRAYVIMVKKYPPNSKNTEHIEQYKKVCVAYKVLSNPGERAEYDKSLESGGDLEELYKEVENYINVENYEAASKNLKDILIHKGENAYVRNLLGICYSRMKEYKKAVFQYEKAIQLDNNPLYLCNCGVGYENLEQEEKALALYKKALQVDPQYKDAYTYIASYYSDKEEYAKAKDYLRKAINISVDVDNIDCYSRLILVYIFNDEAKNIFKLKDDIIKNIPNDDDVRSYAAYMLYQIIEIIMPKARYEEAYYISELIRNLVQGNTDITELCDYIRKRYYAEKELLEIKDSSINEIIYYYLVYITTPDEELGTKDEVEQYKNNVIGALQKLIDSSPDTVINDMNTVKSKYRSVYNIDKENIDKVMEFAKEYKNLPFWKKALKKLANFLG